MMITKERVKMMIGDENDDATSSNEVILSTYCDTVCDCDDDSSVNSSLRILSIAVSFKTFD